MISRESEDVLLIAYIFVNKNDNRR